MTFYAYRATAFNHTHENKAFNKLHDLLQSQWADRDDPLYLLGNFYVNGYEIDALVIKRDAFIVIDFKDYGGKLKFSENGKWRIDGKEVRGGNKANPFQQIRDNKYALLDYLKKLNFISAPDLGHIAGLCLFHQPIEFDEREVPHNVSRWFHVADIDKSVRSIEAIVSPVTNLPDPDLKAILSSLDVPPYYPDGRNREVIISRPEESESENHYLALNTEQSRVMIAVDDWLDDNESHVLAIGGAFYTGKSKVLKKASQRLVEKGKNPIYIAPNARIANLYKERGFPDTQSIYSWLYAGTPNTEKWGKQIYPVSMSPLDIDKDVLIFLESHLVGDEYFEAETTIYGSGYILKDLLNTLQGKVLEQQGQSSQATMELKKLPKILIVGDPYQLTRGSRERSLLRCQGFEQRGIHSTIVELNAQDRDANAPVERLEFQKTLIEQIKLEKFTRLPICNNGAIKTIQKGDSTNQIVERLLKWPKKSFYLCAKNETAQGVNIAIRRKYLKAESESLLVVGDIIDFHNRTPKLRVSQFEDSEIEWVQAGQFGRVTECGEELSTKSIRLKGRDQDTIVRFAKAKIEFGNGFAEIRYLPDYLSAVKPELTQDQMLALQIWAREEVDVTLATDKEKLEQLEINNPTQYEIERPIFTQRYNQMLLSSPYTNVAKLRFAYALTVHRAQTYDPLPLVILDGHCAHDTENPATDSYFRWLYTATVCTSDALQILEYPKLTPLSKAEWVFSAARISQINFKTVLYYQKDRKPIESEMSIPLPNGFSNPGKELLALLLTVNDLISESEWHVDTITQHNYKERYLFVCDEGKVELDLNYDGKFGVSIGITKVIEGPAKLAREIQQQLFTVPIYNNSNIEMAVSLFQDLTFSKGWVIISVDEKPFKVFLILEKDAGRIKVELNVPSDASVSKKGVISSIKVQEADSEVALANFEKDFDGE